MRRAVLPAILLLCGCGPKISDRRTEKLTFPGGEVLIDESRVQTEWACLRGCEPLRHSELTLRPAAGRDPEKLGEMWSPAASGCCVLASMKPITLERSGELESIAFGNYLFTKWEKQNWSSWDFQQDLETQYFLRHFPCETFPFSPNGPPPCRVDSYREIALDLGVPIARVSRSAPKVGWPSVLVYSAPAWTGWQFDIEQTLRANPSLQYKAFRSDLEVEARILQADGEFSGSLMTPEDFTRHFPGARVLLQQTLPISTTAWTTVSAATGSAQYSHEVRAAYGDPDPDWATIYTRFSGWKGHDAHFLRVGEWLAFGASGSTASPGSNPPGTTAGYIRLARR